MLVLCSSFQFIDEPKKACKKIKIGDYTILRKITSDSKTKVYLAQKEGSSEVVAMKSAPLNSKKQNSILNELSVLKNMRHKNIVSFKEFINDTEREKRFLVLEYATLGTLEKLISKRSLNEKVLACIFAQILEGLRYMHSHDFVHLDIKPSNILLFSGGVAKISDFGTSRKISDDESVIGSPAYQAPEVLCDFPDAPIELQDIWSLGVSLYEAYFKQLPFSGETIYEIAIAASENPLVFPSPCSEELKTVIQSMLSPNPTNRPTADQLLETPFFKGALSPGTIQEFLC